MTREGIYVSGKEVVERYIGDKLIWKKYRFRIVNTLPLTISNINYQSATLDCRTQFWHRYEELKSGYYYLRIEEKFVKVYAYNLSTTSPSFVFLLGQNEDAGVDESSKRQALSDLTRNWFRDDYKDIVLYDRMR